MVHRFQPFLLALQFLTRIPVPRRAEISDKELGHSVIWYPLVGIVIGIVLVMVRVLTMDNDAALQAALILTVWVLITGALHLDGLADSADAWLGGHGDRERTLKILKDPLSGPAALVIVTLVLILKFASLEDLAQSFPMWPALLVIPMLARAAAVALFLTTPYVRPEGIGAAHAEHLPLAGGVIAVLLSLLVTLLFLGWRGIPVIIAVVVAGFLLWTLMHRRIGGTTGDTAGALIELTELTSLVVLALVS